MSVAKSVPLSPLQENWFKARRATRQLKEQMFGENPRAPRVLQYILKNTSPGDPQAVLDAMDHFGRHDQFLMNVGDEKGLILDAAVRQSKAGRALELGCYCGYSAVRIGRLLQESFRLRSQGFSILDNCQCLRTPLCAIKPIRQLLYNRIGIWIAAF